MTMFHHFLKVLSGGNILWFAWQTWQASKRWSEARTHCAGLRFPTAVCAGYSVRSVARDAQAGRRQAGDPSSAPRGCEQSPPPHCGRAPHLAPALPAPVACLRSPSPCCLTLRHPLAVPESREWLAALLFLRLLFCPVLPVFGAAQQVTGSICRKLYFIGPCSRVV